MNIGSHSESAVRDLPEEQVSPQSHPILDQQTGLLTRHEFLTRAAKFAQERHAKGTHLVLTIAEFLDFDYLEERHGEKAVDAALKAAGRFLSIAGDLAVSCYYETVNSYR